MVCIIKIQRKYISITQLLEIQEIEEVIQHSSKVVTFLISPLLNNTDLSFHPLFQIFTFVYQLLNVSQPGHFGD